MDAYKEAVQDIEERYAEKRDAVTEKYEAKRRALAEQREGSSFTSSFLHSMKRTGPAAAGGMVVGAVAGVLTGNPELMWPSIAAGGFGAAHVVNAYDERIDNQYVNTAERVEKGWYNTRERAAKGKAKAASWADIDGLLERDDV